MEASTLQWVLTVVALIGSAMSVAGLTLKLGKLLQAHESHGEQLVRHAEAIEDLKVGHASLEARIGGRNVH